MRSIFNGKFWIILVAMAGLVGLIVLASGLSAMKFDQPGTGGLENFFNLSDVAGKRNIATSSWLRYALFGMFILLFVLMLGPMRPQTSKNLLMQLARFSLLTFVMMLVMSRLIQGPLFGGKEGSGASAASNGGPQTFTQPEVSTGWEYGITSFIVIALGVIVIVVFNRLIDRWFQPKKGLDEIAEIARSTLTDLSDALASENAIIRCYVRMTAAVDERRGISRDVAMTPAEFAERLERAGLPRDSVHGLTRVFERVRYGGQSVDPDEIKEAKHCLTSILKACETQM